MQVFMPFESFRDSVRCLDPERLGNQVWREAKTLLEGGWKNHPAAKLWANYKPALALYCCCGLDELQKREAIQQDKYIKLANYFCQFIPTSGGIWLYHEIEIPPFMGCEEYHRSHRLNLLFKNPEWYSQYFTEPLPQEKPEYVWPLHLL